MAKSKKAITRADVERYEFLRPLLDGLYDDVRGLAGRKQDGVFSKQRIASINKLLGSVRELLSAEPTFAYLELLDEGTIPRNADVLLVLGQYRSAMEHFHDKYTYEGELGDEEWSIR